MAFPGIRSAETVGLGAYTGATVETNAVDERRTRGRATLDVTSVTRRTSKCRSPTPTRCVVVSVAVSTTDGVAMQGSPALDNLIKATTRALNHFDLDRLGVAGWRRRDA